LFHDPNEGLKTSDNLFTSINAWKERAKLPILSVFRGVDVEKIGQAALLLGNCTVVLDEFDRAAFNKKWVSPSIRHIVHEGRHRRVNLMGTFRRTANVPEDLLSQADVVFLLKHSAQSPYDLMAIDRRFGPKYAQIVQGLGFGEFIIAQDD